MCRNVIDDMRRNRFGRIVNITSINGHKGQFGQSNYCASKAGITGFSKALALEEARNGITVNCVAPGYCATDMVAAVPEAVLTKIVTEIPVNTSANPPMWHAPWYFSWPKKRVSSPARRWPSMAAST
jgi:acetoacetyl-CoA reductase